MNIFKKKLPERQLVIEFLTVCQEDTEKTVDAVIGLLKKSPIEIEQASSLSETRDIIAIWIFAINMLPVLNVFEGQLQKNIFRRCIKGFSALRGIEESSVKLIVDEFIADFNENYHKRTVGRYATWLIDKIFGERINDPVLHLGLDLFASEVGFKWKKATDIYNIIPDNPVIIDKV